MRQITAKGTGDVKTKSALGTRPLTIWVGVRGYRSELKLNPLILPLSFVFGVMFLGAGLWMLAVEPGKVDALKIAALLVGIGFLAFCYYGIRHREEMFAKWF